MNSTIQWDPVIPAVPLLLSSLTVLALLTVLEWRRKQRFLWVRIGCQVLAVISAAGLLARPYLSSTLQPQPVIVLTEGFDATRVDSLVSAQPGAAIVSLPGTDDFQGAIKLGSLRDVRKLFGDPVWVVGSGIPEVVLGDTPFNFTFLPASLPEGITRINYPGRVIAERWASVTGTYHSSTPGRRELQLVGPGGLEDSTTVKGKFSQFSLSFFPKVAGKTMYKLIERDSNGTLDFGHSLPVVIDEDKKLNVILINDYPSFEQRHLKNFLASKGHKISIRNRVSRDRFHQEFANRAAESLDRLTPAMLDKSDILIIDQQSYRAIPETEKRLIKNAIEGGLGLLVLVGERSKAKDLLAFQSLAKPSDTVRVSLGRSGSFTLPATPVTASGEITPSITAIDGTILAGCQCNGNSRLGFQLLRETYQLGLQARIDAYTAIWSPLIELLARRSPADFSIVIRTPFPLYSNEPIDFDVLSAGRVPVLELITC